MTATNQVLRATREKRITSLLPRYHDVANAYQQIGLVIGASAEELEAAEKKLITALTGKDGIDKNEARALANVAVSVVAHDVYGERGCTQSTINTIKM